MATDHAEIVAVGPWMLAVFVVLTVGAVAAMVWGAALDQAWLRLLVVTAAGVVASIAIGSLAFTFWGMVRGFHRHFTP